MSEQQNHRLIHFEVIPPTTVWDAIAQRLDDDNRYAVLSHKLSHFETNLPESAWLNIAQRLDDDTQYAAIASKFNNYEVNPPAESWNNINQHLKAEAQASDSFIPRLQYLEEVPPQAAWKNIAGILDEEQQLNQLSNRLLNFSAAPPADAWTNIANAISEEKATQAPVISFSKFAYRIAAAAIVVGLLIGGWLVLNKQTTKTDFVKNKPAVPSTGNEKEVLPPNKSLNDIKQQDQPVAVNNHANTQHTSKKELTVAADANKKEDVNALKHADVDGLVAFQKKPIVITGDPIVDKDGNVITDFGEVTTHSYVMVMGPNGQATRLSSKFANYVRYLDDKGNGTEEYLDRVIVESDYWKKLFQAWRNKISQSSYIPSSSNFLDIVEFKDLIQEKR
ncbi:MAG: hypothetical protein QM726_20610 [Chitinophagaceae bacterium]